MRTGLGRQGYREEYADDPAMRERFVAEAEIPGA